MSLKDFTHRLMCCMAMSYVALIASCTIMPNTVQGPRVHPRPPTYLYTPPPQPEIPAHLFDGVVAVYNNNGSMGSGFVVHIDANRVWIMTALHVIDSNIGRASLPVVNGQAATILAVAPQHDLAVIQVPNVGTYDKVLTFAETFIGDEVRAVGFSRYRGREVQLAHYGHVIATTFMNRQGHWTVTHNAGVRGGLSGGPLLNTDGEVVGISIFFVNKAVPQDEWNSSEVCAVPGVSAKLFLNMALPCTAGPPNERIPNG